MLTPTTRARPSRCSTAACRRSILHVDAGRVVSASDTTPSTTSSPRTPPGRRTHRIVRTSPRPADTPLAQRRMIKRSPRRRPRGQAQDDRPSGRRRRTENKPTRSRRRSRSLDVALLTRVECSSPCRPPLELLASLAISRPRPPAPDMILASDVHSTVTGSWHSNGVRSRLREQHPVSGSRHVTSCRVSGTLKDQSHEMLTSPRFRRGSGFHDLDLLVDLRFPSLVGREFVTLSGWGAGLPCRSRRRVVVRRIGRVSSSSSIASVCSETWTRTVRLAWIGEREVGADVDHAVRDAALDGDRFGPGRGGGPRAGALSRSVCSS